MPTFHKFCKIQDYGIIGDCRAAALVSKWGSVDWLCWPRFDSPSIFGALLDSQKGGYWSIRPSGPCDVERAYIRDSNVLQTRFTCPGGRATLTDLMPVCDEGFRRSHLVPGHELVREVVCTAGEIGMAVDFSPRPNYGAQQARIQDLGALGLRVDVGRGAYWLRSNRPLRIEGERAAGEVSIKRGERLQLSLTYAEESPAVLVALEDAIHERIERSVRWWRQWAAQCSYHGPYREAVVRSALALKLLAYSPSGAITAAATTSLPERVGDTLNWDYRYCWLRDASLTIRSLLGLGYAAEAESFLNWLLHATRLTQPRLRVLYNVFGGNAPRERELNHLDGYMASRPVRIGNLARAQLQLDVYGEVIDGATQVARRSGRLDRMTQKVLVGLGKYVARNWDHPDEGIWEPRSGRQDHTYSRLMCWVALDRLLALQQNGIVRDVPRELFERERERLREQIRQRAWNERMQSYVSALDTEEIDATLLRIPWYGFEGADSARMRTTYARVREKLEAGDGLFYRYRRQPPEGAFGICGFWHVEYLAMGRRLQQAHDIFGRLLGYSNDLGLLAEETDPRTGEALGNFPQAFTHVGLISAALALEEEERGEPHPSEKPRQYASVTGGGALR